MNISFAGCGFMGIYHVGVSSCLQTYAPFMLDNKIAGASAGSLAASALVGGVPLVDMVREVVKVACQASEKILGPFNPNFNINVAIKEGLNRVLPDDIHILASARLYISLTRLADGTNWIVSDFDSKEDVINAILGSSFVPLFSGFFPPKFREVTVVDGGYSDNVPTFLGSTITVSPFHGNQDICPEDDSEISHLLGFKLPTGPETNITLSAENMERMGKSMIPPKIEDMIVLCRQGYQDAFRFLRSRNIIQCFECREQKINSGFTRMEEWRKLSNESCPSCQSLPQTIQAVDLPKELMNVFNEELEEQRKRTGVSVKEEEIKDVAKDISNIEQDANVTSDSEASTSQAPPKNLETDVKDTEGDIEVDTIDETSKSKQDKSSQPPSNDDVHIDDKETNVEDLIPVDNDCTSKAPSSCKTSSNKSESTNDDAKDANNTKNDKALMSKKSASVSKESSCQPSSNASATNPQDVTIETSNTAVNSRERTSTSKVANDSNNNESGSSPLQATTPSQINVPQHNDKSIKGLSEGNTSASDSVDDNNVDDKAEKDSLKEANNNVQSSDKK